MGLATGVLLFEGRQTRSGAHHASCSVGTGDLSLEIKRAGREAIYLPLTQNEWSYSLRSLPMRFFLAHRDSLNFAFLCQWLPDYFF